MFIQVLQGPVSNPGAMKSRFDDWNRQLGPSAEGWLGTTAGVTADGEFVAAVRFSDEAAARRNSDRPEQGEWWAETEKLFDGEVTFHDYSNTDLWLDGGSDDAGFVQVIQGRFTGDGTPADFLEDSEELAELRPEIIGGTIGWSDDGHFTEAVYFTSEEAAREGEKKMDADPKASQEMQEWVSQVEGLRFLDLTDPWLTSP